MLLSPVNSNVKEKACLVELLVIKNRSKSLLSFRIDRNSDQIWMHMYIHMYRELQASLCYCLCGKSFFYGISVFHYLKIHRIETACSSCDSLVPCILCRAVCCPEHMPIPAQEGRVSELSPHSYKYLHRAIVETHALRHAVGT